jgi:hypothetical protein
VLVGAAEPCKKLISRAVRALIHPDEDQERLDMREQQLVSLVTSVDQRIADAIEIEGGDDMLLSSARRAGMERWVEGKGLRDGGLAQSTHGLGMRV